MFRAVDLPPDAPGKLLLHSMPGRYENIESVWAGLKGENVNVVICLAEADEIRLKSAGYAQALEAGTIPCPVLSFEIPDREAAADREGFWNLICGVARRLIAGEVVLAHCAGGVGRTAMFAVAVLIALGEAPGEARRAVSRAGSTMETAAQSELIAWCAARPCLSPPLGKET